MIHYFYYGYCCYKIYEYVDMARTTCTVFCYTYKYTKFVVKSLSRLGTFLPTVYDRTCAPSGIELTDIESDWLII